MAKKKAKRKPKKTTHGGRRAGAGRKATGRVIDSVKYIRCSKAASKAIDEYLNKMNADRASQGLKSISLSRWGTEALLYAAGREDLIE